MADPAFTRTFRPRNSTWPKDPTGYRSYGESGKLQTRNANQVGAEWRETYGIMKGSEQSVRDWVNYLRDLFKNSTIFTITHLHDGKAYRAVLHNWTPPEAPPDEYYAGMVLHFREVAA